MLRPSKSMAPAVGSSAARMSLAVVVFPQPDSPTSPRVSPFLMLKLMPSTAFTQPWALPRNEAPTGKCFLRSRTSSKGSAMSALGDGRQPAPRGDAIAERLIPRLLGPTALHRPRAARMEAAARREVGQIWRLARDRVEGLLGPELRDGVEQGAAIRMQGVV